MIEDIQADIIEQLQKITSVASVGVWQGDIEDLLGDAAFLLAQRRPWRIDRVDN